MSHNIFRYLILSWLGQATAAVLFGGWGIVVSTVVTVLFSAHLRKHSLWILQVGSTLAGALVIAGWPEVSQLAQDAMNESAGWHLALGPSATASIATLTLVVSFIVSATVQPSRY